MGLNLSQVFSQYSKSLHAKNREAVYIVKMKPITITIDSAQITFCKQNRVFYCPYLPCGTLLPQKRTLSNVPVDKISNFVGNVPELKCVKTTRSRGMLTICHCNLKKLQHKE